MSHSSLDQGLIEHDSLELGSEEKLCQSCTETGIICDYCDLCLQRCCDCSIETDPADTLSG